MARQIGTKMDRQVSFYISDTILRWMIGLAFSIIIGGAGTYMHWINLTVDRHEHNIIQLGENLDVIQAELALELKMHGVIYNGPPYQPLAPYSHQDTQNK